MRTVAPPCSMWLHSIGKETLTKKIELIEYKIAILPNITAYTLIFKKWIAKYTGGLKIKSKTYRKVLEVK